MRYYLTTGLYATVAGTLHLTDAQASARMHALVRLDAAQHGENRFTTRAPVGFKAGETFGCADALRTPGTERVDMTPAQFDKRVKAERETAAADKRQALEARQARAEALRRSTEEKARAAAAAAKPAKGAQKAKGAAAAVAEAAGSLFGAGGAKSA